jgi:tetratricopeptide (TPR) repeat protein
MLNLCCFLAPNDIPLDLLIDHADTLPDDLAAALRDPLARNAALNALERYSLLARADGTLNLHRLVQTVARDQMGEEKARVWAESAVKLVFSALPDWKRLHEWKAGAQFLPHMMTATNMAVSQELETTGVANLCNWTGYYLQYVGNYTGARPFYERALAIHEKTLGPDHPDTATSLNNLAVLFAYQGDFEQAIPLMRRVLSISERKLGASHLQTQRYRQSLANMEAKLP